MGIRSSVTMGRQRSRSWQALKAMSESAMDLRQFRYYIEGTSISDDQAAVRLIDRSGEKRSSRQ